MEKKNPTGVSTAREAVLAALRDGPVQAAELAGPLGVNPSTVRRHLEALLEEGQVAAFDRIDGPGRPKKLYALTEEGLESFPRDYALLVELLLDQVESDLGREPLVALMDGIAARLGRSVALAAREPEDRLRRARALYNDLGFEAAIEDHGEEKHLVQRNCPFLKVARRDPDALCSCLDEGILRTAIPGVEVELLETMARGSPRCRHRVVLPR